MTSKTKYIVIVLLLLVLATTSVGLSTWNIHYQAIVGDIDFTAQDPSTKDSVLNRYIYFTPAKDADGNITTIKQSYPIGRGGAEDIFTYIYDANTHTPTVFVPSEGNVKGSDNYPTDLFLADGALDLNWGITNVFDEIEFKYEYRLIAMPYVSEDYKGKSENFCEITAIEYYENRINVYLTWKNGNKGNNQGENVLVELLLSGGTFNIPQDGMSDEQYKIVKGKIENNVSFAVDTVTVGVNGFSPFTISTADNGWVETAPSNAGVYQCRITAQLKDGASGNIDTANKAIAQLNSLAEGEINYAAQVTYAILPRNSEMAQIGYTYEKSSATEQQIKARRNLANTMPLAESAEVTNDEDGLHDINGNSNSFYVTYGGVGFEISITSTFETLNGSADVSFPISEYLFTNANALKELLADGQTWDQNENHYYTTYGFSPDPNYQITNPEVHYTILRREVQIDKWTTADLVYNGTAQSQSAHTNNSYDSTFDYSWTKADGTELDSAPIDAGSYKVWASVGENYYLSCVEGAGTLDETSGKVSFDYTIAPKPVTITWTNTDTLVYNGSEQAPTATANGLCTRDGAVDICTVTVTGAQTNARTGYTATATALSNPNYVLATKDGGWTTTFKINQKPVGILWSQNTLSLTYNSETQKPNAYIADTDLCSQNGKKDTCAVIVTGEQTNANATGETYTAKATGLSNPNYVLAEGTWETAFTITPKPVTITWTTDTLVYNGTAQAPTTTVEGLVGGDTCTVDVTGKETNAGTGYTATATGLSNSNYKFADNATLTTTFKIQQLTATLVWANTSVVYDGQAQAPTATVSNLCGTDTCTVTVTGAQTNAGTHTATATSLDNGNYALPTNATQQFEISPKSITLTWSGATLTYNGAAQAPTASIASGLVYGDTCTVDVTGKETNVGNYTATATLSNGNYSATNSTQTFAITQLEIGINWSNVFFTYDGTSHAPTATATGIVAGDTVTITVDGAQTNANATGETYTATATGLTNSNYKLPENATTTFTISPKEIGISWANTSLEYDGTARKPTATATGLVGGDTCEITVTIDEKNVNIGTFNAEATAVSNPNYKLPTSNYSTHYTITAKPVTITWSSTTLTYNGNAQAPTATVQGLVAGDTCTVDVTTDGDCINAGTGYTANATLEGDKAVNYTITSGSTTTFTINKAPNAIVWANGMVIDAENNVLVGWTFGSEPIAHTATAAQGGNVAITYYTTYNATTGECSGEFTPSSTTSAGTYYAKAVSQDSGSNYHGTSIVMSFAVTEPSIEDATVELSTTTLTYNGSNQTVGVTVTLPSGTVLDSANYTVTYTLEGEETGTTSIKNAGTYTVTITGIDPYKGEVEITDAIVVAKAENKITSLTITGWTYGESANEPSITATYTTGVTYTYSTAQDGEYTATVPTNAGTYYIKAEIPESANYLAATATTATFTISRKTIAKPAVPEGTTFTYNGEDQLEAILEAVGYDEGTMTVRAAANAFKNAGTNKNIQFTPIENHCWSDGTTGTISVLIEIERSTISNSNYTISDIVEGEPITIVGNTATGVTKSDGTTETVTGTYSISDASNAVFSNNGESSQTVTRTIQVLFTPTNNNYQEAIFEATVNVKAVAYIGTTYFGSIEDAVNTANSGTSKTIYVIPNLGHTITISSTITLNSGTYLYIPFDGTTVDTSEDRIQELYKAKQTSYADSNATNVANNRVTLIALVNGADIIINSGATLSLGAEFYNQNIVGKYAEINLDTGSGIDCYGTFNCYGYVKENADTFKNNNQTANVDYYDNSNDEGRLIKVYSGGTLLTPVGIYDMQTASDLLNLKDSGVFPLSRFDFPNLQTYVEVEYGASFISMSYSVATSSAMNITLKEEMPVVASSGSIFVLESGSIAFEYCPNNVQYTSTTGLTRIYIGGKLRQGGIELTVQGQTIDSKETFLPLSHRFNIFVLNGGEYIADYDVKFLPGALLKNLQGGKLQFNSKIIFYTSDFSSKIEKYPTTYGDAQFINNGTLTIGANGAIGGFIQTEAIDDSASLDFSACTNSNAFTVTCKEGENAENVTITSEGYFADSTTEGRSISQFVPGSVITSSATGLMCWEGQKSDLVYLTINVSDTDYAVNVYGYQIYIADDANGTNAIEITSGLTAEEDTHPLNLGKYVQIVAKRHASAVFADGTALDTTKWYEVTDNIQVTITPSEGIKLTIKTVGNSGNGGTSFTVYESDTAGGSYYEIVTYTGITNESTYIAKNFYFKIVYKDGTGTTQLDTGNFKITWADGSTATFKSGTTVDRATAYQATQTCTVDFPRKSLCVVAGTQITMADGTTKKVEDIKVGDIIMIFNHETGRYESSIVTTNAHADVEWGMYEIINLEFDDRTKLRIHNEHILFDYTLMQYVPINLETMYQYIGDEMASAELVDGKYVVGTKKLVNAYLTTEYTGVYNPVTYFHMNCVAEGLLTMPGAIMQVLNVFEYDSNLKYNEELKQRDIEAYGLYTYESFSDIITKEMFDSLPVHYMKVAIAKGHATETSIRELLVYFRGIADASNAPPQENTNTTDAVEATLPPPVATGSDDNSGDGDGDSAEDDTSE